MSVTVSRLKNEVRSLKRRYRDFLETRWMTKEEEAEYVDLLAQAEAEAKLGGRMSPASSRVDERQLE